MPPIGEILKENGYATSWFGKDHNTPGFQYSTSGRALRPMAVGMGFQYFYGFLGGETDQWTPYLFRNHGRRCSPWVGHPGYNLITDMADDAIRYMRDLNASAPDKPFLFITCPAARTRPTSRSRNGSTSSMASSTWAGKRCASRSSRTRRSWA